MGLDGVELVMAYEEEFGILISDEQAEQMTTPRKVIDFIFATIEASRISPCPSQRTFHRLRCAFMKKLGLPRDQFKLETKLETILPRATRRETWLTLQAEAKAILWPELRRPGWFFLLVTVITTLWLFFPIWPFSTQRLFLIPMLPLFFWLSFRVTRSMNCAFPKANFTVEDLVHSVVLHEIPSATSPRVKQWTREMVAEKVRKITIEQLGINEKDYREDARYVEDLGVD